MEIEEKIQSVVRLERDKMNTELQKKDIERLQQELDESEEYAEELEKILRKSKHPAQNSPQTVKERNVSSKDSRRSKNFFNSSMSKEDQETLNYFNALRQAFTESELLQVM